MFGHLADPNGANNPLSQVLYGLALRYEFTFLTVHHNLKKDTNYIYHLDTAGDVSKTNLEQLPTSRLQHPIQRTLNLRLSAQV